MSRLNVKILAIAIAAGIVANLAMYQLGSDEVEAFSGWRDRPQVTPASEVISAEVKALFGVVPAVVPAQDLQQNRPAGAVEQATFIYEGVVYRLAGLVISGSNSSATLIGEGNQSIRLAAGDRLPAGGTIRSINLSQIVVEDESGNLESVEIYR